MNKKRIFVEVLACVAVLAFIAYSLLKWQQVDVSVERSFAAPVGRLWSLWNNSDSIQKWWGPKNYTAPVIQNDFREGGYFLFSMKSPDEKVSWNTGRYIEIVPHQKIVSAMAFANENAQVVPASYYGIPGAWGPEVTVSVEFTQMGDKSLIKITESGIPLIMYLFAKLGWQQQFDKIEELLK